MQQGARSQNESGRLSSFLFGASVTSNDKKTPAP
jgi:hypothetical protein